MLTSFLLVQPRSFPATKTLATALFLAAAAQGCGGGGGGSGDGTQQTASAPSGTPATPTPSAAPAQVAVTTRATGLSSPWGMAFLLDGRLLVTERTGGLKLLSGEGSVLGNVGLALPNLVVEGQGGLMDVALDPAFASNGRVYLSFSERDPGNPALNGTAVARGELSADARTLSNVTVIYRQQPKVASTAHFGSRLVFDREGRLWVTLGDRRTNEQRGFAQDLTRGNGKVVRITTDGAPAPGNPTWPAGALAETWSYGLRNPQGAAVHPATGDLWTSDHGPQGGDEINRTVAGANFGWPLASHGQEYGTTTPVGPQTLAGTVGPAWVWNTRDGQPWTGGAMSSPAPAGISFYTGTAVPQWNGNLFVTSLAGRALWRLTLDGNTVTGQERLLASRNQRLRDVEQGPDGALYLLTDDGQLLRYGP